MAASALTKTLMVLEEFRKLHSEMPLQIAVVLLHIAKKPDVTLAELAKLSGLGKSSISRHVAALSEEYGKGTYGAGLVSFREDPNDRRNKIARLTVAGERFMRSISHIIDPEGAN